MTDQVRVSAAQLRVERVSDQAKVNAARLLVWVSFPMAVICANPHPWVPDQVRVSAALPHEWVPGPMKWSATFPRPEPRQVSGGTGLHLVRLSPAPPRIWVPDLVTVSAARLLVGQVSDQVQVSAELLCAWASGPLKGSASVARPEAGKPTEGKLVQVRVSFVAAWVVLMPLLVLVSAAWPQLGASMLDCLSGATPPWLKAGCGVSQPIFFQARLVVVLTTPCCRSNKA